MAELESGAESKDKDQKLIRSQADLARNLAGQECNPQPGHKQLPVMEAGQMDIGCSYKDLSEVGAQTENNLDLLSLYNQARPSTVHFQLKRDGTVLGGGTGAMVKAEENTCKILTDNHVVSEHTKQTYKLDEIKVVTHDGTIYDAKAYKADPGKDLAVVEIATGDKTAQICKPIEFVDTPVTFKESERAVTIGQPYGTGAFYTSEGTFNSQISRQDAVTKLRADKLPPNDNPDRRLDMFDMRGIRGYSGAPAYQLPLSKAEGEKPKAFGVVDMADDMARTLITPVTAQEVKKLTD
ncbi:MAG: serine protease [Candidatus Obscuribacter sp.]|nr:serine protease [Candidatus Obscuribacter sp.]